MLSDERRNAIAQARVKMQQELRFKQLEPEALLPLLPVLKGLKKLDVNYEIEYLFCTSDSLKIRRWQKALRSPLYEELEFNGFEVKEIDLHYIHQRLFQLYPTVRSHHYQPVLTYSREDVSKELSHQILVDALKFLSIDKQYLYCLYPEYPVVLKLAAQDLIREITLILQVESGVCIFTTDFKRMVYRGFDNSWWWGVHFFYEPLYRIDSPRYYVFWTTSGTPEMDDIFSKAAPAIGATFSIKNLLAAEEQFQESDADTAAYLIIGSKMWIEVIFEKHESYYGWYCYTYSRNLVDQWRSYFKELKSIAKIR